MTGEGFALETPIPAARSIAAGLSVLLPIRPPIGNYFTCRVTSIPMVGLFSRLMYKRPSRREKSALGTY